MATRVISRITDSVKPCVRCAVLEMGRLRVAGGRVRTPKAARRHGEGQARRPPLCVVREIRHLITRRHEEHEGTTVLRWRIGRARVSTADAATATTNAASRERWLEFDLELEFELDKEEMGT